jgi:ribosomal protein S17
MQASVRVLGYRSVGRGVEIVQGTCFEHFEGISAFSTCSIGRERDHFGLVLDRTFTDKASGKDAKRHRLEAMQSFVREGDTVSTAQYRPISISTYANRRLNVCH